MRLFPREMLDLIGRQKQEIFANYMVGSVLINCYNSNNPARLHQMIRGNEYHIRHTGMTLFFSSMKRVGQQAICNQLGDVVQHFINNWTNLRTKGY